MLRPADITVQDVMSTRIVSLPGATSVADASAQLLEEELSGAPVIGENGALLGCISTRDLLRALIEGTSRGTPIRELVTPPETCSPTLDLTEACRLMIRRRVHGLVVLEHDEQVGVLSAVDTVRALACLGDSGLAWDPVAQTIQKVEQ